jgi:hypothetical protein
MRGNAANSTPSTLAERRCRPVPDLASGLAPTFGRVTSHGPIQPHAALGVSLCRIRFALAYSLGPLCGGLAGAFRFVALPCRLVVAASTLR